MMIRNLLILGLFLSPALAAGPDFLPLARDVIEGEAAAFSVKEQTVAIYDERKGTADSDYGVDFFQEGKEIDTLLVFHESYDDGDENPSSHPNIDVAQAEAAPKLAARLKAGEYLALPQVLWSKGKTLKAIDLTFTWKANQLLVHRGKGKAVVLKTVEQRDGGFAPPRPTALYALAGQRVVVLAIHWPAVKGVEFVVPETEYVPLVLPEGL